MTAYIIMAALLRIAVTVVLPVLLLVLAWAWLATRRAA